MLERLEEVTGIIHQLVPQVVEIRLFGSQAEGRATGRSDIDIALVLESEVNYPSETALHHPVELAVIKALLVKGIPAGSGPGQFSPIVIPRAHVDNPHPNPDDISNAIARGKIVWP